MKFSPDREKINPIGIFVALTVFGVISIAILLYSPRQSDYASLEVVESSFSEPDQANGEPAEHVDIVPDVEELSPVISENQKNPKDKYKILPPLGDAASKKQNSTKKKKAAPPPKKDLTKQTSSISIEKINDKSNATPNPVPEKSVSFVTTRPTIIKDDISSAPEDIQLQPSLLIENSSTNIEIEQISETEEITNIELQPSNLIVKTDISNDNNVEFPPEIQKIDSEEVKEGSMLWYSVRVGYTDSKIRADILHDVLRDRGFATSKIELSDTGTYYISLGEFIYRYQAEELCKSVKEKTNLVPVIYEKTVAE